MSQIITGETDEPHGISWRRILFSVALLTMFGLGFLSQHIIQIVEARPLPINQLIGLDQQPKTGGSTAESIGEELDGKSETRPDDSQMIAEAISACRSSLDGNDISALAGIVRKESRKYDYDWELILAIIRTESQFNTRARSNKGARGLMQVLPSTAKWLSPKMGLKYEGRESLYDPEYNVKLGTRYLHMLHQKFGNIEKAIAAYNRGPNGLTRYLRQGREFPPKYLVKVMGYYKELKDGSNECAS